MKTSIIKIITIVLGVAVLFSCKKYKEEFYGPGLGVAPDDFSATDLMASNLNPDFKTGTVHFQSDLSATVRWKLTLVGQTSGAIKIISGLSKVLDVSNAQWDGSTDTLKLFKKGETVTATLTALGWKESRSTTLIVGEVKDRGFVFGTFENITVDHGAKNWMESNGLYWFYSFETNEYDLVDKIADPTAPEGTNALLISGHDANASYYIGQVGLSAPSGVFNLGTINSVDDVYLNFYVKGAGTAANKDYKFVVQLFEDDNSSGTVQYDGLEDKYTYQISLQYEGWKFYSIKYSSLVLDPGVSMASERVYSPSKIANIGFFFGANTAAGLSATDVIAVEMDHFSITTNGPMIP